MDRDGRSPWPSYGQSQRNNGSLSTSGYGRSVAFPRGQIDHYSYMEAGDGRFSTRLSFPVFTGDWKQFQKNCLAEAHVAGVNEAFTIAIKAYQKQWHWPFATDPRQEHVYSSEEEENDDNVKPEYTNQGKDGPGTYMIQMHQQGSGPWQYNMHLGYTTEHPTELYKKRCLRNSPRVRSLIS